MFRSEKPLHFGQFRYGCPETAAGSRRYPTPSPCWRSRTKRPDVPIKPESSRRSPRESPGLRLANGRLHFAQKVGIAAQRFGRKFAHPFGPSANSALISPTLSKSASPFRNALSSDSASTAAIVKSCMYGSRKSARFFCLRGLCCDQNDPPLRERETVEQLIADKMEPPKQSPPSGGGARSIERRCRLRPASSPFLLGRSYRQRESLDTYVKKVDVKSH